MFIKVYKHKSIDTKIDDDFPKVIEYFNSPFVRKYIQEDISFEFENTKLGMNDVLLKLVLPNEDKYEAVMFVYKTGTFPIYGQTSAPTDKIRMIFVSVNKTEDNIDYTWKIMAHEILHAIAYKKMAENNNYIANVLDNSQPTPYFHNSEPYYVGGNFEQQLKVLAPYYKKGYKYFSQKEVDTYKLEPKLFALLDKMRGECGFPFIINSGKRTKAENDKLENSVENSAHLTGLAVDLAINDSSKRSKLVSNAFKNGIRRIGIGKTFIHLDLDETKPQDVVWLY